MRALDPHRCEVVLDRRESADTFLHFDNGADYNLYRSINPGKTASKEGKDLFFDRDALKFAVGKGSDNTWSVYTQAAGVVSISIDGGTGSVKTGALSATRPVQLAAYTVAGLPACNAALRDGMAVVTDATSPTYRGALIGGGSARTPVYCDGSTWTAH